MSSDKLQRENIAQILQTPETLIEHMKSVSRRVMRSVADQDIVDFVFRNQDSLELVQKLLLATKGKIKESDLTYSPPAPVAHLIREFSWIRNTILLYRRTRRIAEESKAFLQELKIFGVESSTLCVLESQGIREFCQLKRLLGRDQLIGQLLGRSNLPISQVFVLEDFMQWVAKQGDSRFFGNTSEMDKLESRKKFGHLIA